MLTLKQDILEWQVHIYPALEESQHKWTYITKGGWIKSFLMGRFLFYNLNWKKTSKKKYTFLARTSPLHIRFHLLTILTHLSNPCAYTHEFKAWRFYLTFKKKKQKFLYQKCKSFLGKFERTYIILYGKFVTSHITEMCTLEAD